MAFTKHDAAHDQYGDPPRDATGTDPHSHSIWSYVFGIVALALLAFALFGSLTTTEVNNSAPPTVSRQPASPPATTPDTTNPTAPNTTTPSPSQAP
jgi:hypothetical protein